MLDWISENFYILFPTALLYLVFGGGALAAVHWLKRRISFTGLYAWTAILAYLILGRLMPEWTDNVPHTIERVGFWMLTLATFFSLLAVQVSDAFYESAVGRNHLNSMPQRRGSVIWWLLVFGGCAILGILAEEFRSETSFILDLVEPLVTRGRGL